MGSRSLWVPFLLAGVAASARPASAQKDDDQWLRRCKGDFGNHRTNRHPAGGGIKIAD